MKMKKLVTGIIAAAMLCSLAAPAYAASITIKRDASFSGGADSGTTYTAYKIFDASADKANTGTNTQANTAVITNTEGVAIGYTIAADSPWVAVLWDTAANAAKAGNIWFKLAKSADGSKYQVTATSDMATQENAAAAAAWLLKNKPGSAAGETLTIGEAKTVDDGYYLIESSLGSNLVLATTDLDIIEKNTYPTVEKEVAGADLSAEIGKPITYTIKVKVPAGANKKIVVTDTMSAGLSFGEMVSVKAGENDVAYTKADATGNAFTITFEKDAVEANVGKEIVITYTAILNAQALVQNTEGNKNTVKLQYDNFTSTEVTPDNNPTTQKITVTKYDGADANGKTPIAGAVFELRRPGEQAAVTVKLVRDAAKDTDGEEAYRVALSNESGAVTQFTTVIGKKIAIYGLDADITYQLVEITPPAGYNALTEARDAKPKRDQTANVDIENNKGTTLPSTGGMGTTLFYLLGAVLMLGAGVVLVARRRMSR